MSGWIKSYRSMMDNPVVCKDADHYAVWGYLLHHASHNECDTLFDGKRITLKPGQLVTGRKKIAEKFHISESKVYRILKLLKNEQQIEQQTSNASTLISILNWEQYQSSEQQTEQQLNNDRTTTEQRVNTIQELKNDKNDKNEKNKKKIEGDFSFCDESFLPIMKKWLAYRREIKKPITAQSSIEGQYKKLHRLSCGDPNKADQIVGQSMIEGWTGLFELKTEKTNGRSELPKRARSCSFANPDS